MENDCENSVLFMGMKRVFITRVYGTDNNDFKEDVHEGTVVMERPSNVPSSSECVRVPVHLECTVNDNYHYKDFHLYQNGLYHETTCTVDGATGIKIASVTEFFRHWRVRYHYREAFTTLCIGTHCRKNIALKIKDLWQMIAKIIYFSWNE